MMGRSIAAVGDVSNPSTWSGTPFHFWRAAKARGFATEPLRVDLSRIGWQRNVWNLSRPLKGRRPGGFQYSDWFEGCLEKQIPPAQARLECISFNQFFPRPGNQRRCSYYIDATMTGLLKSYQLGGRMDAATAKAALKRERKNMEAAERVIGFQRWASESIVRDCGIEPEKVFTVLPGANLILPENFTFIQPTGIPGIDRPLRLCFIGKEWQRKGLPFLIKIRDELAARGWKVTVTIIGCCGEEIAGRPGVDYVGFINKATDLGRFIKIVQATDIGCLFSTADASSIAMLEFLRLGIPVAGFVVDGMGDLLPMDASLRFLPTDSLETIAGVFESCLRDERRLQDLRMAAQQWSPLMTWERCVREFEELWTTGTVKNPVRPWLGLPESSLAETVEK